MVPLFERVGKKLVEYWKKRLDNSGSAVLPVDADLSRTVCITGFQVTVKFPLVIIIIITRTIFIVLSS